MPDIEPIAAAANAVRENIAKVIVGKAMVVDLLLVALFTESHVLLEDVPGLGKTLLARALARSVNCDFQRIQFTPDLLPSDITGVSVYNPQTTQFEFRPGPIISQIVLADEINRAGPRTQAALLEAMQERQVTVDGLTHILPSPFLVLATQNPIELEGTFPLPEAQIDRFLIRLDLGYPDPEEERAILRRFRTEQPLDTLRPVLEPQQIRDLTTLTRQVHVSEPVESYIVDLVRASRQHSGVALGASPRGSLSLYKASQALAAIRGRDYVLPDDVQQLTGPVLAHRIMPTSQSRLRGKAAAELLKEIMQTIPVPVEENWAAHGE